MRSARSTRTVSLFTRAAPMALVAALAGCSGESGTAGSSGTTGTVRAADSVALEQSANGGTRGPITPEVRTPRRGPDFLLGAALHEPIDLTADQRTTIEGLRAANEPSAPHPFDKARASALAASVRVGKVDTTAVAPAPDDAMAARRTALANALTTLHATLTPKQRRALVDALATHPRTTSPTAPGPGLTRRTPGAPLRAMAVRWGTSSKGSTSRLRSSRRSARSSTPSARPPPATPSTKRCTRRCKRSSRPSLATPSTLRPSSPLRRVRRNRAITRIAS